MTTASDSWVTQLAARTAEEISARSVRDGLSRVNERDHLQPSCALAARALAETWKPAPVVSTAVPLTCPAWPRVGRFDIAFIVGDQRPVVVELKCGTGRDAIAACAWDVLKVAFALQAGVISAGYLLAATTSAEWARRTRGSELFDTGSIDARVLREHYVDRWTFWERDGYPAATIVPASLATRAVCQTPVRIGAELWELRVASVEVDTAERIGWEPFLQARTVEASTRDQARVEL